MLKITDYDFDRKFDEQTSLAFNYIMKIHLFYIFIKFIN